MSITQAVILAAGEGLRLKPFTVNKPKAMISIAGKPIIQYVIESLAENNIRNILLIVGYQKEQIFDYIGDGQKFGVEVRYIQQAKQIGGANALLQAKGATTHEFLVLSGNRLISPGTLAPLLESPRPAMLVKQESHPSQYGVVSVRDGNITGVIEKPANPVGNLINAGIYAFNKDIFDYVAAELTIPDAINSMISKGEPVQAVETDQTWLDVVYPWDIISLNSTILHRIKSDQNGTIESGVCLKGDVLIGKDSIIRSNSYIVGPVMIGKGCDIGPNVCLYPSTSIGDNTLISPFTEIKNSVIGNDTIIASGSVIQDSVIDNGCIIGTHFSACSDVTDVNIDEEYHKTKVGAMLGRSCLIGDTVTIRAGTIIGNNSQIKSLKLISGVIPDRSLVV